MKRKIPSLMVIFFVTLFISACKSSPANVEQDMGNEHFEQLLKYITDSENELNSSWDWDEKIQLFWAVDFAIDDFIENSNDRALISHLEEIQYDWSEKRWDFFHTINTLSNDLERSMQRRAIEMAQARHRNSNLEDISLINSDDGKYGGYIYIANTYKILMRGNILGIIGNYVDVTVRGQINMRNNTMQILEATIR
jgi:hypothetical protein